MFYVARAIVLVERVIMRSHIVPHALCVWTDRLVYWIQVHMPAMAACEITNKQTNTLLSP